jgi:hypothetical protein
MTKRVLATTFIRSASMLIVDEVSLIGEELNARLTPPMRRQVPFTRNMAPRKEYYFCVAMFYGSSLSRLR